MSLGFVTLRPRQALPEHSVGADTIPTSPHHRLVFKHPAYPAEHDVFLTLRAFDHSHGGLHYNTARIACGLFAGNRWDGFLTTSKDGQAFECDDEGILPPGAYYFHLPGFQHGRTPSSHMGAYN